MLVAVKVFFHKTTLFNDELFVAGGYANMKRANQNQMVCVDTTAIGGHTIVPITAEMITNAPEQFLSQGIYLTLPEGQTFTGRTAALVLHGRLCLFDEAYSIVGPKRLKIHTCRLDLMHQIMHHPLTRYSKNYRAPGMIIPNSLIPAAANALADVYDGDNPLYANPIDNQGLIDTALFKDPTYLTNLLVEGQSFLILFNTARVYLRKYALRPLYHPGQYTIDSLDTPRGILRYNHAWVLPYVILSGKQGRHIVAVNARRLGDDAYKTMLDPDKAPAPWLDRMTRDRSPAVTLTEVYTS
jgi:hypothetical protein